MPLFHCFDSTPTDPQQVLVMATPMVSCQALRQMILAKGQKLTAFHCVLTTSVLLKGVREAHLLGALITGILWNDGLQGTVAFKVPICLWNGNVEGSYYETDNN